MSEQWLKVGEEEDFASGLHKVRVDKHEVVVARLEGRLYAFDALCPHAGGPMELSELEGTVVSCPLHAWRFDVSRDGVESHGYRGLACRGVKAEGGGVYVSTVVPPRQMPQRETSRAA